MKEVMDYHLGDSLVPGSNKPIVKAIRDALSSNRERCGVLYFKDQFNYEYDYMPLDNADLVDDNHFSINNKKFYDLYLNQKIISLFHSHTKDYDENPSDVDIQVSESLSLPSMIFSLKTKENFIYFPKSESPRKLEKRLFIPFFQDCVSYIKDMYILELGIKLQEKIINWARRRNDPNKFLFTEIDQHFNEVNYSELKKYDVIAFKPSISNLHHLAVYFDDNRIMHHPTSSFPRTELFTPEMLNKVYKIYRHKDL
jgi:proteasome lid subunit RPN8/RPN11